MTNRDFCKKWLAKQENLDGILAQSLAKRNGRICVCDSDKISCNECDFNCSDDDDCSTAALKWLDEQYESNWESLERGTLVRFNKNYGNDIFMFISYDKVENIVLAKDASSIPKYITFKPEDLDIIKVEEN